jgi:hypothetical protein
MGEKPTKPFLMTNAIDETIPEKLEPSLQKIVKKIFPYIYIYIYSYCLDTVNERHGSIMTIA